MIAGIQPVTKLPIAGDAIFVWSVQPIVIRSPNANRELLADLAKLAKDAREHGTAASVEGALKTHDKRLFVRFWVPAFLFTVVFLLVAAFWR